MNTTAAACRIAGRTPSFKPCRPLTSNKGTSAPKAVLARASKEPTSSLASAAAASAAALLLTLQGGSPALAVAQQPQFEVAGIVSKSKEFSKDLQRRSDETFQDINTSPSKTGNPADALRPDLQESQFADLVKKTTSNVSDKILSSPGKALKQVDKVTENAGPGFDFNAFRDKQASQADVVGKDAREKSKEVFRSLKDNLKGGSN